MVSQVKLPWERVLLVSGAIKLPGELGMFKRCNVYTCKGGRTEWGKEAGSYSLRHRNSQLQRELSLQVPARMSTWKCTHPEKGGTLRNKQCFHLKIFLSQKSQNFRNLHTFPGKKNTNPNLWNFPGKKKKKWKQSGKTVCFQNYSRAKWKLKVSKSEYWNVVFSLQIIYWVDSAEGI